MDRRSLLTLGAALAAGTLLPGCSQGGDPRLDVSSPSAASATATPVIAHGLLDFAGTFLHGVAPQGTNAICSPWSIAMVLSMLREGAVGQTGTEIDQLLGGTTPQFGDQLAAGYRSMQSSGRVTAANALWGQQSLAWQQDFLNRLRDGYSAPLTQADFIGNTEQTRLAINDWVAKQTENKIRDLLEPGLIKTETRLVAVNALHFAAPWEVPLTEVGPLPFYQLSGESTSVPTLSGGGFWPWLSRNGWQGTALPCQGRDFALVVVKAQHQETTKVVPGSLFADVLTAKPAQVAAQLPAWKFTFKDRLDDLLKALGLRRAFDPALADLSGMTTAEQLYLGFVVHQAVIEVNAWGIEAAAATAGAVVAGAGMADPHQLVLDHWFSYALMHVPTRTPLFVGQVGDPTKTS
jgi:serpin B